MAGKPFIVGLTLYDTDGTTVMSSTRVSIRNESTYKSLTLTTDTNGQAVFNLANLELGWTVGDIISYFCPFNSAYGSFESTDTGGTTVTLALSAVSVTPTLRYFTVQEFLDAFSLKTYSQDTENGVKPQTVVSIGQGVETQIDRVTYRTWDTNNSAYYQATNEYYDSSLNQRIFFLKNAPIYSIQRIEVNIMENSFEPEWHNIMYLLLDACDAVTGWSAGTDGEVSLNTTNAQNNEGTGCINMVKSGATASSVLFSKTLNSTYDFTRSMFKLDFYVEAKSSLASSGTAVQIRIGSDSSNYYYFNFTANDLKQAGWQSLTLTYGTDDSDSGTTGTPDASNCDYVAVNVTYAASTTTVASPDMRMDNIRFNDDSDVRIDYDISRIEITTASDYFPSNGIDTVRITYKYGDSVPYDIKRLAILMTGRAIGTPSVQRLNIITAETGSLNSALMNMMNYDREIERIIENRKFPPIENI